MLDTNVVNVVATDDGEGGTWYDFGAEPEKSESDKHNENLAEVIPESILASIASDLIVEIEADDRSRSEWLEMREQAIGLLGLKIMPPRTSVATGGAPFNGMSTYQDGALLEASIRFQANSRGELLPAAGPVKVHNEGAPVQENDQEAEALEKAVNKFLTVDCTEYVPDHDRMFFQAGWSGAGFVKGYHCPLKRRPAVESIDAKDLIISNTATDIDSAARVTHVIKMSRSVLIRMQIAGAYRQVELNAPDNAQPNTVVDEKIAANQGLSSTQSAVSPKNMDRTLYECYADYDIPGFEHKLDGKVTGLPVPYKFTIDKTSKKILEVRRNWKESDEQCMRRKTFVMYPFIPAFGFYPLGLMHVMGNSTNCITAAFRIAIDNGMINNFPYWVYAKGAQAQDKTDFMAGPGQGIPFNLPVGAKLSDVLMAAPAKPIDPAFMQLVEQAKADVQRIGGTAEIQIGEGRQDAPVGTTIALIEQATKVMGGVHKRFHQAQAEEFRMVRELLQEDPEALWRASGKEPYNADVLRRALANYELIPQADPNVASHMIRMAKAEAGRQLVKDAPEFWDIKSAIEYYCDQIGMPELKRFIVVPQQQPQQPAKGADNGAKAMASIITQKIKSGDLAQDRQLKVVELAQKAQLGKAQLQEKAIEHRMDLVREAMIHPLSPAIVDQTSQPQPSGFIQ